MKTTQRGVAIVEFALILPFLLLLTMITTEFGRAMYQYNTVVKSLRGAARYLSLQTPSTPDTPNPAAITAATNLIVFGNTAGTGSPLVPGLTASNVAAPTWQTTGSNPLVNTVTVTVTGFTFHPLVTGALGDITFQDISATMRCTS